MVMTGSGFGSAGGSDVGFFRLVGFGGWKICRPTFFRECLRWSPCDDLGGNDVVALDGNGLGGRSRAVGQSGLADARGLGLRIAQVAHGRFGHGQTVGTEAGALDFLLQFLRLLLQVAGALVERGFLGGLGGGLDRLLLQSILESTGRDGNW